MTLPELRQTAAAAGLEVGDVELMSVMSGSKWFDRHPFVLSALTLTEAVHGVLRRPSWAHAVCLRLVVPRSGR